MTKSSKEQTEYRESRDKDPEETNRDEIQSTGGKVRKEGREVFSL